MEQYRMYELEMHGKEPEGSHVAVDLEAVFSWNQKEKRVKGFYAGNGIYKIRFLPEEIGTYHWSVTGCITAEGCETCVKASGDVHGLVGAKGTHFVYADGTDFLPFGTTIYALVHQKKELIAQTLETLKRAPFNKVRHCVFPKHYEYNNNDPEFFAFEKDLEGNWDINRPCFEFWDHMESVIFELGKIGIQSDLILFHPYDLGHWGLSEMNLGQCKCYLDYAMRRLSAIPEIWWSMANEFDLVFTRKLEEWYAIEEFIAANDPYHHLLSNHNCFKFYDFKRPNITHCCVQTPQVEKAAQWIEKYKKPLIYDECCYEGNLAQSWGNISGFEMMNRFWITFTQGAYCTHGEVFLSDDDILWWSKGGVLKGESPARIAFLRGIMEELPGPIDTWTVNPFELMPPEIAEIVMNFPMEELLKGIGDGAKDANLVKDSDYKGHVGEEVYLQYFARHTIGETRWKLPETHKYKIEIIDVWNMTRETALEAVNGILTIKLPSREGIALLATACK